MPTVKVLHRRRVPTWALVGATAVALAANLATTSALLALASAILGVASIDRVAADRATTEVILARTTVDGPDGPAWSVRFPRGTVAGGTLEHAVARGIILDMRRQRRNTGRPAAPDVLGPIREELTPDDVDPNPARTAAEELDGRRGVTWPRPPD